MRYLKLLSVVSCSVMLSACYQPGTMPRGYASYNQPYKSAPGTKAAPIGYEYSQENNTAATEALRPAVKDLVAQMEESIDPLVDRIYLAQGAQTAFYSAFDHALREELTYRGYELATQAEPSALPVYFSASQAKKDKNSQGPAMFNLALSGKGKRLASGTYELPSYAFTETSAPRIEEPKKAEPLKEIEADDDSAPVPITEVTAEPLMDEGMAPQGAADMPAQTQTTP